MSGNKQKEDLTRQIEGLEAYCEGREYEVAAVYSDIGSGINDGRKALLKMMDDATRGRFDVLVANYQDRLSRFGVKVIEKYLESWDVGMVIRHPHAVQSADPNADLITDLTAILYSFMGKMYRKRRGTAKARAGQKK